MPGADIITIVTLGGIASRRPKISEIARRTFIVACTIRAIRSEILVVANDRARDRFYPSPAWVVGLQKGLIAATFVLNIPERQDSCQVGIHEKIRGVFLPAGAWIPFTVIKVGAGRIAGNIAGAAITGSEAARAAARVPANVADPNDIQIKAINITIDM